MLRTTKERQPANILWQMKASGDNSVQMTLAEGQSVEFPQGVTVTLKGGLYLMFQNGVQVSPPPANDVGTVLVPKASVPDALTHSKPGWLTKEFIAGCQTGDVLPDGTIYVCDRKGRHFAMATEFASPMHYGCDKDLGSVGEFIKKLNTEKAHGYSDWEMPNTNTGHSLDNGQQAGALKNLFASVRSIWLAQTFGRIAEVQWFDDVRPLNRFTDRSNRHSVCAVRRLVI